MKSIFKKIGSCVVALCLIALSTFVLAGCGGNPPDEPDSRVMNVDVNPKLEFVLDEDNKVVSVSALNDDGECLIQTEADIAAFKNLDAEEAAKKFLEMSKEYGFVVEADSNALTVSISGEGADKLLNDVKSAVESKISELDLSITVSKKTISRETIEAIALECYQEYTQAQIDAMDEDDLIEMIEESRIETESLLSQDLKAQYYIDRAKAAINAKISAIEEQISATNVVAKTKLEIAKAAEAALVSALDSIKQAHTDVQVAIDAKMSVYAEYKKDYIEARKAANAEEIARLQPLVAQYESELNAARAAIDSTIATIMQGLQTGLDALKANVTTAINNVLAELSEVDTDAIDAAIVAAKDSAVSALEDSLYNKNYWTEETPAA